MTVEEAIEELKKIPPKTELLCNYYVCKLDEYFIGQITSITLEDKTGIIFSTDL